MVKDTIISPVNNTSIRIQLTNQKVKNIRLVLLNCFLFTHLYFFNRTSWNLVNQTPSNLWCLNSLWG